MVDNNSILIELKKTLSVPEDYTVYDMDIMMFANSAFSTLTQIGVGPPSGFVLNNKEQKWSEYGITPDIMSVKSYIWASVRLMFDPPGNSFGITAIESLKTELVFRLNVATDRSIP